MTERNEPSDALVAATEKAHQSTTLLHAFIYFAPEAMEEYTALGVPQPSQYFGPRTAAMGPLPTEMVIATFYNFSPDLVIPAMDGLWNAVSAVELQAARWRGVRRVLDAHVRPVMSESDIAEAITICERALDGLSWAGRPMAAGNNAAMTQLDSEEFAGDALLRLWQLVTIVREWRGDAHIALLTTEPLSGAECTAVSAAQAGEHGHRIRSSRGWGDSDWATAVDSLRARGWLDDSAALTDHGSSARAALEQRTNGLSAEMWAHGGEQDALRLDALLRPATKALLAANYFAAIGRPARPRD